VNLLLHEKLEKEEKVKVKTRYSATSAEATIIPEGKNIKVIFDEPQKALTPGQSAVFYVDNIVLGRRQNCIKKHCKQQKYIKI